MCDALKGMHGLASGDFICKNCFNDLHKIKIRESNLIGSVTSANSQPTKYSTSKSHASLKVVDTLSDINSDLEESDVLSSPSLSSEGEFHEKEAKGALHKILPLIDVIPVKKKGLLKAGKSLMAETKFVKALDSLKRKLSISCCSSIRQESEKKKSKVDDNSLWMKNGDYSKKE